MAGLTVHKSSAVRTFKTNRDLTANMRGAQVKGQRLVVDDAVALRASMPMLAANVADFGRRSAPAPVRAMAAWIIGEAAQELGAKVASPNALYAAMADGKLDERAPFTIPAINVRGDSLDTARAVFRAAIDGNVGPLTLEVARSETGYTAQSPMEYAAVMQAAAMMEGYEGPFFLQGDHVQLKAKAVRAGGEAEATERATHSNLIKAFMAAGFGALDLDMSPLEDRRADESDLSWDAQQRENYTATAVCTAMVRQLEQQMGLPWSVLVGGESGEVGKMNSRDVDLIAFGEGFQRVYPGELERLGLPTDAEGVRKIAVQSGTSHGGVPLPDGSVAQVKLDMAVLKKAREVSRRFGWAGGVQHGASTLPNEAFNLFPANGAVEVHLATGFQNQLYDLAITGALRGRIYQYLVQNFRSEWKEADGQTWEQFVYKTRKKGLGPFKRTIWTIEDSLRQAAADALTAQFAFLFGELGVRDSQDLLAHVDTPEFHLPFPEATGTAMVEVGKGESDAGLAD